MKKRIISVVLMLVMLFTMGGCGKKTVSAGELLEKAYENSKSVTNMTAKYTMQMDMSSAGQSISSTTTGDITAFTDPYKVKMNMTMDMGELGSQDMEMYMAAEGENYYTYTGMSGVWYKQSMDKELFEKSLNSYNSELYLESFVKSKDSFTFTETTENDKELYQITGTLSGEALADMVNSTDILSQMESFGIDSSLYEDLEDLNITLYLDKESCSFYKMSLDMTKMMQEMMSKAMDSISDTVNGDDAAANASANVDISKCVMEMEYTGYNNAEDFEIPEEALNAEELDLSGLNDTTVQ